MFAERIGSSQLAELAAQGATLTGGLRAGELPRLAAVVARGAAVADEPLAVTVSFANGPEAHPVVRIRATGPLALVCQRCLGPVQWPVAVDVTLTAVPSESRAEELADPFDCVLLDGEGALALREAIEDEILATLPLAPLHEDATCASGIATSAAPARATVTRPFAGLGDLLKQGPGDGGNR
jgi:uncharacterized protein